MIFSMTGFGSSQAENNSIKIEVEAKSINSRYLDIYLKLPTLLMNKEYELRELIKAKMKRGKISVIVNVKKNDVEAELPVIDKDKLKLYLSMIKDIKKTAKITEKIKLEHLLSSEFIFSSTEKEFPEEDFLLLKRVISNALDELLKMKKQEGKELAEDLKNRIAIIEDNLSAIENESAASVKEYFEKLKEKAKQLVENISEYNDRLEVELALIAEKADITEECVRLKSHLKFFLESVEQGEEPGRKLNFLCQEMNREINTISSKSVSIPVTHNAVLIKEEIEKIREQLQNIE